MAEDGSIHMVRTPSGARKRELVEWTQTVYAASLSRACRLVIYHGRVAFFSAAALRGGGTESPAIIAGRDAERHIEDPAHGFLGT